MRKFFAGLIVGTCLLPVLGSLTELGITWCEAWKIKPSKIISKGNADLTKMSAETNPTADAIGFEIPSYTEEDMYEEEYEDE